MKKQGKKWMLVALVLLAVVTVALPLVGCKNDSVSEQTGVPEGEKPTTPEGGEGTGTGDGNGEAPKTTSVSFTDSSGTTHTFTMVGVPGNTEGIPETEGSEVFVANRSVKLSDFYIGKHEVTQELYEAVMTGNTANISATPSSFTSNPYGTENQGKRPVEKVSWYDAVYFCNELTKKTMSEADCVYTIENIQKDDDETSIKSASVTQNLGKKGYRLPTEAEWEYAARGGAPDVDDWNYVFSGADTAEGVKSNSSENPGLDQVGWYLCNITTDTDPSSDDPGYGTHEVGKKAANRLGIHDMSGNVWEWCWDKDGTVSTGEETNPTGPSSGDKRVQRGGCWSLYANYCSVSSRLSNLPYNLITELGFRVVRGL